MTAQMWRSSLAALRALGSRSARRARRLVDPPLALAPRIPESILISPPDIMRGDPRVAAALYGGEFALAGHVVRPETGSPFDVTDAPAEWRRALHGFGWLRHCRAAGTDLSGANARALTSDWFARFARPGPGLAWEPVVAATRLRHWLSHSRVLLGHGDFGFYDVFLRQLALHHRYLRRAARDETDPLVRLRVLAVLAIASLAFPSSRREQARCAALLTAALDTEILPDGGHVSRRADVLVDLLADLLPLAQCYVGKGMVAPRGLTLAIDRILPMLRMQVHRDGTLAAHGGTRNGHADRLEAILELEPDRAALTEARESGFERLAMGEAVVIADTGARPAGGGRRTMPNGSLSFELSSGSPGAGRRLVVNLGPAPPEASEELRAAMRGRAAHSTLSLDTSGPARTEGDRDRRLATRGEPDPTGVVEIVRADAEDGSFRGFGALRRTEMTGVMHERTLTLIDGGSVLRGLDRLVRPAQGGSAPVPLGAPGPEATVRFHLHPRCEARLVPADGTGGSSVGTDEGSGGQRTKVHLFAPGGEAWEFSVDAGVDASAPVPRMAVEPSYYCGGEEPVPSQQIVLRISGATSAQWRFARRGSATLSSPLSAR